LKAIKLKNNAYAKMRLARALLVKKTEELKKELGEKMPVAKPVP
jgi:hypothetical protein